MKDNPYVGPRPYERQDQHNFFGREREARELRALVLSEREVLFYAQSGAGKTSLLNARVIPALEEEGFLVLPLARVGSELPPGIDASAVDNVFVFGALLALSGEEADPQALLGHTLRSFLAECCPVEVDEADSRPLVLILDQFEELFTTHRDHWEDAEGFFQQVREALDALPELGVVLVMREDHLAELDPYAPLFPRRLQARFRLERLGPQGALAAIRRPAENAGCRYDAGVAERLVDDLRRSRLQRHGVEETVLGPFVEPVQLQVVCSQLWDKLPEQEDRAIQWEEVEEYGNVDRALTGFYESALEQTCQLLAGETPDDLAGPPVTERQLRRWFGEELITPMGTRGLVLRGPEETATLPNAAVDALQSQHIIRADARAGTRWYELAHDRLVDPVLESNRSWAAARETPLRAAAQRWKETGDAALLYLGAALKEAAAWAGANPGEVEEYEAEFLAASEEAEQARLRRRRWLLAGAAVVLVVLVTMALLSFVAFAGQREANRQRQTAEVAAATSEGAKLEELRQRQTAEAAAVTSEAAKGQEQRQRQTAEAAIVTSEAALGEAETERDNAAAAEATAEARRLEAEEARAEAERQAQLTLSRQLAAQSGNELAKPNYELALLLAIEAGRKASTSEAWAALRGAFAHPGRTLFVLSGHTGHVVQAAWNADESRILTAGDDGTVRVWGAETGEELLVLTGHTEGVNQAAWNGDESRILTAGDDGTARVWDAETGEELLTLSGHRDSVNQASWSTDGSRILTAGDDGTARVWDAFTGEELLTLSGQTRPVRQASWNHDGSYILTAGDDGTPRVWDAVTGEELLTLAGHTSWRWDADTKEMLIHGLPVTHATWSTDGSRILTAGRDSKARVWDAETGQDLLTLDCQTAWVVQATWNGDESRILTAGDNTTARVWDAVTGEELLTLSGHTGRVVQASWNHNESRILTAGEADRTARVWDAATGEELLILTGHTNWVVGATWNADGSRILTASDDGTARVWAVGPGEELPTLSGHRGWVHQASWNDDESRILTAGEDGTARVWDARTGEELVTLSGHTQRVTRASWNADGSRILTASDDGTARVWDAVTGKELLILSGHTKWRVYQATWNADGSRILFAGCDRRGDGVCVAGTVRVWDAETGQELLTLSGHTEWLVYQAMWNEDESRILTRGDDGTVRVWDAGTGEELVILSGQWDSVNQASWNDDEICILTASDDGTARVWDAVTGKELLILSGHEGRVNQAMWNADESRILTASSDRTAKVWDAGTGEELLTLAGHAGGVMDATWNADGSRIVTTGCDLAGLDGCVKPTARVWHANTGQELFILSGHTDLVVQATWNADGSRILTASWDGTARLWYTKMADLLEAACQRAPRNMTWDEWRRHIDEPYRKTCADLPVDPTAVEAYVRNAADSARNGDAQAASATYQQAIKWADEISKAATYHAVCRSGALHGFAELVLPTCECAVELMPHYGEYRDSRSIARALTEDAAGAIEDFQLAVHLWRELDFSQWDTDLQARFQQYYEEQIQVREGWIAELEAGRNPFDEETLEALRNE